MKDDGFTLVELLIAISISAIVGGILVTLMVQSQGLFSDQSSQVSHGLSINSTLSDVTSTVKQSISIASTYPPSGSPQFTTSSDTLVLKLPSTNAQGAVIENVYDYAVFSPDSTNPKILRKRVFPDATSTRKGENKVFTTNASLIKFNYLDNFGGSVSSTQASKINFIINLLEKAGSKNKTSSGSADINLKNY